MYKSVSSIQNIISIFTLHDNYILVDKNDNFYFNGFHEEHYQSLYFISNRYILKNKEDKSFLFLGDNLIRELQASYLLNTYSDNGCFYYENLHYDPNDNKVKKDIYYHDFKKDEKKIIKKETSENFLFKDFLDRRTITFEPKTIFRSLSLLTGEYDWELDLGGRKCMSVSKEPPRDATIQQIIGVWEHQLLVFLDNNQILSLDINKGEILWELPDFDVHFPTGPNVSKSMHFHWHLEKGKLYILKHHQYYSVDLNTQEVALLWQNEDTTYTINHCTYTEDYIYFTAYGKEIGISILGVFNRKTLQIDWLEKMIMPRIDSNVYVGFHQAPQVGGNKLYVLDSGGTLHIFEREG